MKKEDRISKWIGSEQEMSDQIMEEIAEALDTRDVETLKEMFSQEAFEEATELEQQIADIMSFYQGKMVNYKGDASSSTSTEYGEEIEKEFIGYYTLVTDKQTYQVGYDHKPIDNKNPKEIGLRKLELVTMSTYEKDDFHWQHYDKKPGVYIQE